MGHRNQGLNHFDEAGGNDEKKQENHHAQQVAVFIQTRVDQPVLNQDVDEKHWNEEEGKYIGGEHFPNSVSGRKFLAFGFIATDQDIRHGNVNEVVHLYGYDSYEDRQSRRIILSKSPEFKRYIGKVKDLIVDMKNQLMTPATFSKIK